MADFLRTPLARPAAPPKADRRRHQRVKVNLLGRFMLENKQEFACQVRNMSPGGATLVSPVSARLGERIVAYVDHVGRLEGRVARLTDSGFAITIETSARKREKLAEQLTWLANRHVLNLPEDRRHERFSPQNPFTTLERADRRQMRCRMLDVSLSGAALALPADRPDVGEQILVGRIRARVVRHFSDGVAVEFAFVQTQQTLEENLT